MFSSLFRRREPGVRQILLHNHLFKNAGTTIDWALKRSFGRRFCDHRDDQEMVKGGMPYVVEFLTRQRPVMAISSHHMPFDPDFETAELAFWHVCMLRHPIARALSVYRYEKSQPARQSLGAKMAKQLDMRGYFEWRLGDESPAVLRDSHTRLLSGLRSKKRQVLEEADLERAGSQARRPRVLVGLVERFDESMVLFEHALQGTFENIDLTHVVQNKSREQVSDPAEALRAELGDELYAKLLQKNAYDMCLYEDMSRELDRRMAAIADFDVQLTTYRDRCA